VPVRQRHYFKRDDVWTALEYELASELGAADDALAKLFARVALAAGWTISTPRPTLSKSILAEPYSSCRLASNGCSE
jgi:hypothetical protein